MSIIMNTKAYGAIRPISINRYPFYRCRSASDAGKQNGMKCPNRVKKTGEVTLWEGEQNGDVLDPKHL
jgi:hypothetical protein